MAGVQRICNNKGQTIVPCCRYLLQSSATESVALKVDVTANFGFEKFSLLMSQKELGTKNIWTRTQHEVALGPQTRRALIIAKNLQRYSSTNPDESRRVLGQDERY
jgi:hypothetical protein